MEAVSVGARLKDARVARGLSLEDIANATKIPRTMLQHLEADAYGSMPAAVFVRGFIRAYAKCVAIDPNPIVRAFQQRTSGPMVGLAGFDGATANDDDASDPRRPRSRQGLSTNQKLVPLEPVSERREGSFRRGYALLAVVAVGLLIAAWLMVGGQRAPSDASARGPAPSDERTLNATGPSGLTGPSGPTDSGAPALHERIDGVPAIDGNGEARRIR